jgi:hypothetical protein
MPVFLYFKGRPSSPPISKSPGDRQRVTKITFWAIREKKVYGNRKSSTVTGHLICAPIVSGIQLKAGTFKAIALNYNLIIY